MLTIKDFMETVNYRITEGTEYTWRCYGDNAYSLDSWDGDNDNGHSIGIIFDLKTQVVYEMSACDYHNQRAYRWMHPEYTQPYKQEAQRMGVSETEAWEDLDYVDLETIEDILEKSRAIVAGEEYDTRVSVPIDLPDRDMFKIMLMAHELDLTLNEYVERVLRNELGLPPK